MNKELLINILEFLNKVPNRKYGDNYQLTSELEKELGVKYYGSPVEDVEKLLLKECKQLLKTLRRDAKWALKNKWDRSDDGFKCQITLINELLSKLKQLKK